MSWLEERGFTEKMIDRFFRPFYGGVMLDRELRCSSKMLEFTYKMFSEGDTSLPAQGMGAISDQLAARIGADRILYDSPVASLTQEGVLLESGETLRCDQVVIATDVDFASSQRPEIEPLGWRGVFCLYFDAPEPPIEEPILVLNGTGKGPVNNLCVPSQVAPTYAPDGRALVSASLLGTFDPDDEEAMIAATRDHLSEWFDGVDQWRHLRTYHIPRAQPDQSPGNLDVIERDVRLDSRTYVCGDHRETSSIEGAMNSGRRAARALLDDRT